MRAERPYQPSRWRRIAAHGLALLIALDLAVLLALWLHGPLKIPVSALPFGKSFPNPLHVLPVLVAVWCALSWRNWRSWLGLAPTHALSGREVPLAAWLVMPLSAALLVAQVRDLPHHATSSVQKVRKSERKGPAGMSLSISNKHVGPLVGRLVRRERSDPPVVWIEDWDRRGHIAAFYLYPRLMRMEPKLRRYTLRERMGSRWLVDPYFRVGLRPKIPTSWEYARQRGAEFIYAGRHGERQPKRQ